jgi:hypothetical protein
MVEKDRQILASALGASVDCLVTGDRNRFGHLYLSVVGGVFVTDPSDFQVLFRDRLIV